VYVSTRKNLKLRATVEDEIRKILDKYPDGNYDKTELLGDVQKDLDDMVLRLGISPKTPIHVFLDGTVLVVKFGKFPQN
jgi:hypothetical protein